MASIPSLLNKNDALALLDTTLFDIHPQDLNDFAPYGEADSFGVESVGPPSSDSLSSRSSSPSENVHIPPPNFHPSTPNYNFPPSVGLCGVSGNNFNTPAPYPTAPPSQSLWFSPTPPPPHLIMSDSQPILAANPPIAHKRSRVKFTAADLKAIMGLVVDINPYMAKHGSKGQMWKDIADGVRKKGFCTTHSETTIKKKVEMLLAYHEVSFIFFVVFVPLTSSVCRTLIVPQVRKSPRSLGRVAVSLLRRFSIAPYT